MRLKSLMAEFGTRNGNALAPFSFLRIRLGKSALLGVYSLGLIPFGLLSQGAGGTVCHFIKKLLPRRIGCFNGKRLFLQPDVLLPCALIKPDARITRHMLEIKSHQTPLP